jgi:hypothetical protein
MLQSITKQPYKLLHLIQQGHLQDVDWVHEGRAHGDELAQRRVVRQQRLMARDLRARGKEL